MTDQRNEQRKKFTVTLEEHVALEPIAASKFLTSNCSEAFLQTLKDVFLMHLQENL